MLVVSPGIVLGVLDRGGLTISKLKISEENQIELSRLKCKEYLDYTVKPMKTDELNIRIDSTQSDFLQRSLEPSLGVTKLFF